MKESQGSNAVTAIRRAGDPILVGKSDFYFGRGDRRSATLEANCLNWSVTDPMQYREEPAVTPFHGHRSRIDALGFRMSGEIEDVNDALPEGLAVAQLVNGHRDS